MCLDIRSYMKRKPDLADMLGKLPENVLDSIIRTYRPGEVIIRRCEGGCDTFYILQGVCCSTCNFVSGGRIWFRKATVGDVFGLCASFHGVPDDSFSATVLAKFNTVLAVFPQALVHESFRKYPLFAEKITGSVLKRLNNQLWHLSECNFYPALIGIITYFIYAYEFYLRTYSAGYTGPVKIPEKRQEIAQFMGMNGPVDKSKNSAETHSGPGRTVNLEIEKDGIYHPLKV